MAANKRRLAELGMATPLIIEVAAQITAKAAATATLRRRLMELSMPTRTATYLTTVIPAQNATYAKMMEVGIPGFLAKELVDQINS